MTAIAFDLAGADALQALAAEHLAGEFRIIAPLGRGAWGERFAAEDLHRAEEVVLTLLPPLDGDAWREEERFLEALRAVSLIEHPHLAPVRAYGVSGPLRWFALLTGGDPTLAERVATEGALPMAMVRRIAQQLASGLDQARRRGVIHGALTAAEVRIDAKGWVRLEGIGVGAIAPAAEETSDQVGLAELVRYCLTGGVDDAPLPPDTHGPVYAALLKATRPLRNDRFGDLLEFVAALDGVATATPPLRPTIPVGQRVSPADWNELLDTEPEAPRPSRRGLLLGGVGMIALVALITAAIPIGRRWARADDGRVSYPAPLPVASPVQENETALRPAPPPADPPPPAAEIRRAPTPKPAPARTPVAPPPRALPPSPALPPVPATEANEVPGALSISSTPWGELSIDGTPLGNTPQRAVPLSPGRHHIRVARDGFVPFEIDLVVRPGEAIRLTQLVLTELKL